MMYMPFRDMLMLHFFIGVGLVVLFALRAYGRQNQPPRWIGDFGTGFFGQQKKWLQWFAWCLMFEFITSIFYIHTGLFYYELGMSIFEAIAMTVGAWVADRLVDFFMGVAELDIPNIPTPDTGAIKAKLKEAGKNIAKAVKPKETDEEVLQKENENFRNLTRGH